MESKEILTVKVSAKEAAKQAYEIVADVLEKWADEGRTLTLSEMREKAAELRKLADEL